MDRKYTDFFGNLVEKNVEDKGSFAISVKLYNMLEWWHIYDICCFGGWAGIKS